MNNSITGPLSHDLSDVVKVTQRPLKKEGAVSANAKPESADHSQQPPVNASSSDLLPIQSRQTGLLANVKIQGLPTNELQKKDVVVYQRIAFTKVNQQPLPKKSLWAWLCCCCKKKPPNGASA